MEEHGNFDYLPLSLQLIRNSMWNGILFVAVYAMNYSCFCCGSVLLVDRILCILCSLVFSHSACFNKTQQNCDGYITPALVMRFIFFMQSMRSFVIGILIKSSVYLLQDMPVLL